MTPIDIFQKLLKENNLKISLSPLTVRHMIDGAIMIENPQLLVDWLIAPKPTKPAIALDGASGGPGGGPGAGGGNGVEPKEAKKE